jgi:hypothetical protein
MGKKLIPDEIRAKVSENVEKFNQKEFKDLDVRYVARFKGRYLYLDRVAYGENEPISRLEYLEAINKWEFAIFKWSTESYDANDFFFPGSELFNGTVEGAMKAGMKAHPV